LKIIRALIGSTIGLITTIVLLLVFEAIGLIDAYLPLSNLLAQYELEMVGNPDALGFWFKIWNLTLFSQVSFYWIFSFDMFHISYIFLFIAMLGGFLVIGIVASNKIELFNFKWDIFAVNSIIVSNFYISITVYSIYWSVTT
jgi:hypothetical protein